MRNISVKKIKERLKYMREVRAHSFAYRDEYRYGYTDAVEEMTDMIDKLTKSKKGNKDA